MNTLPHRSPPCEPTMKQLWLACYTSLLCQLPPREAVKAADEALELCNKHWADPPVATTWEYKHNFPVGFRFSFPKDGSEPSP